VTLFSTTKPMPNQKHRRLRSEDRRIIEYMHQEGCNQEEIAREIGFDQSTVSRELRRNGGKRGYKSKSAQRRAGKRAREKAPRSPAVNESNREEIERRLRLRHSPEQVAGAMALEGLEAPSTQSIYLHIYADKKVGGDLSSYLRINNKRRYMRRAGRKRDKIPNRIDISERPAVVDKRSRFGDWEADLIVGCLGGGYLLTLVERRSRYGRLIRLDDKKALTTGAGILCGLHGLGVKTITYDNGPEFAAHYLVSELLSCQSFFCKPYASWEKGAVENFNGLVRQYFPAGTDFNKITEAEIKNVEQALNSRPRKVLAFQTPLTFISKLTA